MKKTFLPKVIFTLATLFVVAFDTLKGQTWNLVDISELTSTDIFVILDTTSSCAMINSNGASSAPTPYPLTLNSDKTEITSVVPDNCKWNIGEDATGYILYPNGTTETWLYSTSTNNGIRVGTNTNKHFIMESNYLKNVEYGRYVGIYNGNDWRSYTSIHTNISSTRTCFFRLTESTSSVPRPTFSVNTGTYYTPQTVTIACEEPDAVIYYTLDGTEPNESSLEYISPITITQTTTLKAIAVLNDESSPIATATYTFPIDVADLATLRQGATDGTLYHYTGTATVTFANNTRHAKYIQDATAAILIDDSPGHITSTYVQGDAITGVVGTLQVYQGMLQFVPTMDPGASAGTGSVITPIELTCEELLADAESYEAQLVTLTNVVISTTATTFSGATYYDLNGNNNPKMGVRYNDLDLVGEAIPTVAQNITGVVFDYNGTYEIFPRSMSDLENYEDIPIVDPQTFYVALNVAGLNNIFDTLYYTEGEEAVELPTPLTCKGLDFIGWASAELTSPVSDISGMVILPAGTFIPTQDTTLYAIFMKGWEFASSQFYITRESFEETVTPYGTLDAWLTLDPNGIDTLEGYCDLYTNNNAMQMNATRAGMYNTRPVTGIVTGIRLMVASNSSTRTWAPYVANVPLTEENYLTEGTPLEPKSIAGGDSDWWDVALSDDYHYFYLAFNTAAAYLDQVEVSYFKPEAVTYLSIPQPDTNVVTDIVCAGQSYYDWGFSIDDPATGIYFVEMPSEIPYCSEVMRLELTVEEPDTIRIDTAACGMVVIAGDPDRIFTETTSDTISEPNPIYFYACPITTIYNITIYEPANVSLSIDTCYSYTWGDDTYYESGEYVKEFLTTEGCDSIVTLNLTIRQGANYEETVETCGYEYVWTYAGNVETLTASGTYTRTVAGEFCDDTYTLHLTLNAPDTTDLYAQICSGETYNQYGFNESEAGDYELTLTNAANCDSIVRLHLAVGSATITELADEVCLNTHYTENGFDIMAETAGVFTHSMTIERPGTCDSIVNLTLTVRPTYYEEISDEACGTYTWNNTEYTESGTYTWNGQAANGCDSTVVLTLTIHQPATLTITDEACSSYEWNGTTYTESGEYTWLGQTAEGCDSIVTLQLTINTPDTTDLNETAIDSYTWNEETFNESGVYTRIFTNIHNCDSVVNLHLTITHNYTITFDVNGNTSLVPSVVFNTNDEPLALPTPTGCGAVAFAGWTTDNTFGTNNMPELITTLAPTSDITLYAVFMQMPELDSIVITRSSFATVSGYGTPDEWQAISTINGTAITGIADLYTNDACMQMRGTTAPHPYNATELPGNIMSISIVGAGNGSPRPWTPYLANTPLTENNYSEDGIYLNSQTAADNASEVRWEVTTPARYFYLKLSGNAVYVSNITVVYALSEMTYTLDPTEEVVLNESICNGQTYTDDIFNESEAGTYEATIPGEGFCATHYTLHLTVNQPVETEITEEACGSYEWNNQTYSESGNYTATFTAANGCDSVVTLHLTINQPVETEITDEACVSYDWNGQTYNESGDYTATFTAANGCDSVVTLHLTINQPVETEITDEACVTYDWNGQTYNTSGDYTATFTAANGCDSVVTLHLTIHQPVESEITDEACMTYDWNGQTYNTSGDYTATFTAANGCDSVVTLHLTINQPVEAEITDEACVTYNWNGQTYNTSGDYTVTFTAANGCDSVVTLHLTIHQPVESEITDEACVTYTWNGQTYSESGDYPMTFTAANGCDSVVTLHLTINQPVTSTESITICASELPYTWNDIVFEDEGMDSVTLTAANGCDSLVIMTLTVTRINIEVEWNGTAENFHFLVAIQDNAEYQWIDCSTNEPIEGATQQQFFPLVSGSYACIIALGGCADTTDCVDVSVGIDDIDAISSVCYPNPTSGLCTLQIPMMGSWNLSSPEMRVYDANGRLVMTRRVEGETTQFDLSTFAPGVYLIRLISDGQVRATHKVLLTK
jgi:uncharacterized repeat protein (TIGR02543 family)